MGVIPATASAISMGRVARAYGLGGASPLAAPGGTIQLRATIGAQISIVSGAIALSSDFGGRTTGSAYPTGSVGTY